MTESFTKVQHFVFLYLTIAREMLIYDVESVELYTILKMKQKNEKTLSIVLQLLTFCYVM